VIGMKLNIALFALLAALLAAATPAAGYADDAGSQRISIGFTTLGFCGLRLSWECAVAPDLYVGAFWQTSALMLAQGEADLGELGLTSHWERELGAGFFASAAMEAGYRYHGQNLGFTQSAFSRLGVRAGYRAGSLDFGADLGWDQSWVTAIRLSDSAKRAWDDRYAGCAAAPESAVIGLSETKFRLGGFAAANLGPVGVSLAGGAVATPGSPINGFDGMMFGFFPFYADLAVRIPL
jgi:hypothetical protein